MSILKKKQAVCWEFARLIEQANSFRCWVAAFQAHASIQPMATVRFCLETTKAAGAICLIGIVLLAAPTEEPQHDSHGNASIALRCVPECRHDIIAAGAKRHMFRDGDINSSAE
jgi:hypothetical protein